jgi:hypothetical protein
MYISINFLLLILFILSYFYITKLNYLEKFQNPLSSMASSISNPILQEGGPNIDISKIDFSKLSDEEYAQLLSLLSGSYLNPLIKNLVPT